MHRTNGPLFVKGSGQYGQGNDPDILNSSRPDPDQPGLWCQWVPTDDGTEIVWDEGEKFYNAGEWMEYIVSKLLAPSARSYIDAHINEDERLKAFTCDHVVAGVIDAQGEDSDDFWRIQVENNIVKILDGHISYDPVVEHELPPDPAEVGQAIRSIIGKVRVKVHTLTVDADDRIVTQVFATEDEVFSSLKANYGEDLDVDLGTVEGRSALVDELTERQGIVLYIDWHVLDVEHLLDVEMES